MENTKNRKLVYQAFLQRENQKGHHKYDQELRMYDLIRSGDMAGVKAGVDLFPSDLCGHLSDDPVMNYKYMFVASITLTTRFSIEGGLDEEDAYNASDMYIQRVDSCGTLEEIFSLYQEMLTFFTQKMAEIRKKKSYSKPVVLAMDYVYYHLHEKITRQALSDAVGLNPDYLSRLFRRETGQSISEYILSRRIEAAKSMLLYSDMSYSEISATLAFSSQSYFISTFKKQTGLTPASTATAFSATDSTGKTPAFPATPLGICKGRTQKKPPRRGADRPVKSDLAEREQCVRLGGGGHRCFLRQSTGPIPTLFFLF